MTWVIVGRRGPELLPIRSDECREDVVSRDGKVVFNRLQQHPDGFDPPAIPSPVEEGETGTTDPWGITDGAVGG